MEFVHEWWTLHYGHATRRNFDPNYKYYAGSLHRIGAPAYTVCNLAKTYVEFWWRILDTFHRIDGPSLFANSSCEVWTQKGKLHRIEGIARRMGLSKRWYLENREVPPRAWQRRARRLRWLALRHI